MNKNKKKRILLLLLVPCILLLAGGVLLSRKLRFVTYIPVPNEESTAALSNPCIGFYQIHGYLLEDTSSFDLSGVHSLEYGPGLVLLQFNLQSYASSPISQEGLVLLDQILSAWQSTGRQLIVRFLYDWDGDVQGKEPEELSRVLEHMTQTAQVLNQYVSCIYILQGVYLGAWGEMHSSPLLDEENLITLITHLSQVTDERIYLSVRTPAQWRTIVRSPLPLSREYAFCGSLSGRLGLYNDGMLGSASDVGTYAEPEASASLSSYDKWGRQREIDFQNALCAYVPNGGEVIQDNPWNDFPQALIDLSAIHASYLNSQYDREVLDKWALSTYHGNDPYDGMDGLSYISRHLGYRYVLRESSLAGPSSPLEEEAVCTILLENVGFSVSYRPFAITLVLEQTDTGTQTLIPIPADLRLLSPGGQMTLTVPLQIRDYATGTYTLSLKIMDPASGFPICLANETGSGKTGYTLGTLTIRKLAQ